MTKGGQFKTVKRTAPHPKYHEMRCALLEFENGRQRLADRLRKELADQLKAGLATLEAERDQAVKACGFDPKKTWLLNTVTKTITEAQPG